jgi:hypothetical protein
VAEVGRSFGVGWWTVMNAVRDHGEPLVDDPGRSGAVGGLNLDETAWLRANATRHTAFLTGFVDIIGGVCSTSWLVAAPGWSRTGWPPAPRTGPATRCSTPGWPRRHFASLHPPTLQLLRPRSPLLAGHHFVGGTRLKNLARYQTQQLQGSA